MMDSSCHLIVFIVFVFACSHGFLIPDGLQAVHTNVGDIRGHIQNAVFDGTTYQVRQFLGIPYAKPPIGDLRYKKPEPLLSLPRNPFVAMKYGPACPQIALAMTDGMTSDEDCLFLNIFAPMSTDSVPKAVMVSIHGGGFFMGSADLFDGSYLSAYGDVIVVTLNYRLGPLGFFSTHSSKAPGNYGLWDQQLAIQWVSDNIAAFGGDPGNISIFGESAGGSSVIYQTLFPGNRGIVKRAMAQSGTLAAWGVDRLELNQKASLDFATFVGCANNRTLDIACMRAKSTSEIKTAAESFFVQPANGTMASFVPVFDNDFVLQDTDDILRNMSKKDLSASYIKTFLGIDLLIGMNNFDGDVYFESNWKIEMNQSAPLRNGIWFTEKQFEDIVIPGAAKAFLNQKPNNLVLEVIKYEYTNRQFANYTEDAQRLRNVIDISTDFALNAPTVLTANRHQLGNASTYLYQFAAAVPRPHYPVPFLQTDTAANHGDDLLFLFGFPRKMSLLFIPGFTDDMLTAEHFRLSKTVMMLWSNFAKSGNPNTPADVTQLYPGVVWPGYDINGKYLEISPRMSAQSAKTGIAARAVEFWNGLIPELQCVATGAT